MNSKLFLALHKRQWFIGHKFRTKETFTLRSTPNDEIQYLKSSTRDDFNNPTWRTLVSYKEFLFVQLNSRKIFTKEESEYILALFSGLHEFAIQSCDTGHHIQYRMSTFEDPTFQLLKFEEVIVLTNGHLKNLNSVISSYWSTEELVRNLLGDLRGIRNEKAR